MTEAQMKFDHALSTHKDVLTFAKLLFAYDPAKLKSYEQPFCDINSESELDTAALAAHAALNQTDESIINHITSLVRCVAFEHARTESDFDASVLYLSDAVKHLMHAERAFTDTKHKLTCD